MKVCCFRFVGRQINVGDPGTVQWKNNKNVSADQVNCSPAPIYFAITHLSAALIANVVHFLSAGGTVPLGVHYSAETGLMSSLSVLQSVEETLGERCPDCCDHFLPLFPRQTPHCTQ